MSSIFNLTQEQTEALAVLLMIAVWIITWLITSPSQARWFLFGIEPIVPYTTLTQSQDISTQPVDLGPVSEAVDTPIFDWAQYLDDEGKFLGDEPGEHDAELAQRLDEWGVALSGSTAPQLPEGAMLRRHPVNPNVVILTEENSKL